MKSKLEVYALAVSFAAVVCLVISAGIGGYALIKIMQPELTLEKWDYNKYQSNDAFWESMQRRTSQEQKPDQRPAEEDLTKRRLESYSRALSVERRGGVQTLMQSVIFFLAGAITLFVHWRIARRARQEIKT
jgi:hypothetical protein